MKTSELTGAALDWAVAKCEGFPNYEDHGRTTPYSTDWGQGGPIIEREHMEIYDHPEYGWTATIRPFRERGDTPLIAAMRCYCCAKLGDEIDIPEELCRQQSS